MTALFVIRSSDRLGGLIRTTNLLERLFGEGRRRSNVIPRFMNEYSGLSLMFAVFVDAAAGWRGVKILPAVVQQLASLRTPNPGQIIQSTGHPTQGTKTSS